MLQRGLGSGFIISNDGYILTNYHVVVDADKIMVAVSENEKEQYQATLIGKDKNTDVALIKIDPKDKVLPVVALGDSDALEIGDWVIAIGSPFGLGHTLTQGIVSAKARIIGAGPYDNFIQTDAAINFGNSGGPMFNMKGQVVGINTAIVASGQNIGFAIPINMVRDMLPDLKSKGEVTRGWLGVSIQEVTPEIAKAVGLKEPKGAMVTDVFPGNPAAMAGVKKGDIILSINGHYADDASELTRFIGGLKPGAKVSIVVWRDRKEVTLSTELMKRDDEKIAGISGEGTPGGKGDAHESKDKLGLSVSSITPDIARRYRIQDTAGVIVTDVDPKGLASASEIRKGDIIREVNGQGIKSVSDYVNIINKAEKGQSLLMLIERAGRSSYLAIEVK
jgi:serine protease Do